MKRVAIIGGGLAGITAAWEARKRGAEVVLFECKRHLGGRASSYFDQKSKCLLDNGQHIFLGCCSEQRKIQSEWGISDCFDRFDRIPFAFQTKRNFFASENFDYLKSSAWLPHWFQFFPSFLGLRFLSWKSRLSLLKNISFLSFEIKKKERTLSLADWLKIRRTTLEAVEFFWQPLIFSVFSETLENVSILAVQQLIRKGFQSNKDGMTLWIPNQPLQNIYHSKIRTVLQQKGVDVRLSTRIEKLLIKNNRFIGLKWRQISSISDPLFKNENNAFEKMPSDSFFLTNKNETIRLSCRKQEEHFDLGILSVDPVAAFSILTASDQNQLIEEIGLKRMAFGAITAVHLWFDRRLIKDFACAIGNGPGQWLFCPLQESRQNRGVSLKNLLRQTSCNHLTLDVEKNNRGTVFSGSVQNSVFPVYHQVLISASHRLLKKRLGNQTNQENLLQEIMNQIKNSFSEGKKAKLLNYQISTVPNAVSTPLPANCNLKPSQKTSIEHLALAGDWTATDFPSTLEGAIRSGTAAVQTLQI
ncbi:MAG: FAD-dependent oxidoreductase [Planctomycetia bacterium]|nr:FAD-dependent oxidoreductase [Planctomycetia bacterium]